MYHSFIFQTTYEDIVQDMKGRKRNNSGENSSVNLCFFLRKRKVDMANAKIPESGSIYFFMRTIKHAKRIRTHPPGNKSISSISHLGKKENHLPKCGFFVSGNMWSSRAGYLKSHKSQFLMILQPSKPPTKSGEDWGDVFFLGENESEILFFLAATNAAGYGSLSGKCRNNAPEIVKWFAEW